MFTKIFIIAIFLGVVVSLGSGLFYLVKGKGDSNRMAKALTWRISISVALFGLLFLAWAAGLIQPHGILPP